MPEWSPKERDDYNAAAALAAMVSGRSNGLIGRIDVVPAFNGAKIFKVLKDGKPWYTPSLEPAEARLFMTGVHVGVQAMVDSMIEMLNRAPWEK